MIGARKMLFYGFTRSVAASSAASSASSAATVVASAGAAVAVEKEDSDKNDPEALVVLENVT